ncbi:MAG: N-6 DNA methylase [Ruminococcus sp.]|nr:N-6 DNA methylase [Ruminococcus sp.]
MEHSSLRKFALRAGSSLSGHGEAAYLYFMCLGAAAVADYSGVEEIMSAPEELRSALFTEKCRQLAVIYGGLFRKACELPLPPQLLAEGGTAAELLSLPRELFGHEETIGWLHQYYNEPDRNETAAGLKNSKRLSADRIAAATQIFTPEWVVRYMVQNTLTRYIREHGYDICTGEYCFDSEAELSEKVLPEEISLTDPCMGGGNVLLYAFDVFMELYRLCGYTDTAAAEKILSRNLFGLELDERACAAAETALRIKAARYGAYTAPNVYDFSGVSSSVGSLMNSGDIVSRSGKAGRIRSLLDRKYDIVVTNPPYLGRSAMNEELSGFVRERYGAYGADLFSVFMVRCLEMTKDGGYMGFLTPSTWLFLQSYESVRRRIYSESGLQTLIHFEYSAFGDATVPLCAFTVKKGAESGRGIYLRLTELRGDMDIQRQKVLEGISTANCPYRFTADTADFLRIPSAPAAYWLGKAMLRAFGGVKLGDVVPVREGVITGDNERFLRRWFEVSKEKTAFTGEQRKKWYPLNKGGEYRRWYGNREFLINWENDGEEIKSFRDEKGRLRSRPQGLAFNFRSHVSWSQITSGAFSVRYFDDSFMFNVAGTSAFPEDGRTLWLLLGLLNSNVASALTGILNPTLNMNPGDIARLPLPALPEDCDDVIGTVRECAELCREDWDSSELSWDFTKHPLI